MCSDPSRRALIKTVASTRFPSLACITRGTIPPTFNNHDILVLPASLAPLDKDLTNQYRVIVYGPIDLMPKAFLQGCIDYLAEPWYPEELFYRALRYHMPQQFRLKGLEYRILPDGIHAKDRTIPLSGIEVSLLLMLLRAKGSIVPRSVLEQMIPGPSFAPSSRRLDAHMARLRNKIRCCLPSYRKASHKSEENLIRSARGLGYYLITD
ncbi:MAG: winged helix-turn-helix domain-containing protein [Spirochaetes bacterium]|nr:winged helix-turn-helix domain-containing protein [Spirochaetota bacterium]